MKLRGLRLSSLGGALTLLAMGCDSGYVMPTRHSPPALSINCETTGQNPLRCAARLYCSLYPCAPGTPTVVTDAAVWEVGDSNILRLQAPGVVTAAGVGDTFVRATWQAFAGSIQTVSVFPGRPPAPTGELLGDIWEKGKTALTGQIDGARITVIAGGLEGRTAVSGEPPSYVPSGYTVSFYRPLPGRYFLLGAAPGEYRLRIEANEFETVEQDVKVLGGDTQVQTQLQRK